MNALTSPFAAHIARLLAHKRALGVAYHRERKLPYAQETLHVLP